jgi:hypothetical protein
MKIMFFFFFLSFEFLQQNVISFFLSLAFLPLAEALTLRQKRKKRKKNKRKNTFLRGGLGEAGEGGGDGFAELGAGHALHLGTQARRIHGQPQHARHHHCKGVFVCASRVQCHRGFD